MYGYLLLGLVAAILVVAAGFTGAMVMRRHQLKNTLGTFECDLSREGSGRWVPGICRYADHSLEFLKLRSISPIPAVSFTRTAMEIVSRSEPEPGQLRTVDTDAIIVDLATDRGRYRMGLSYAAYTGLSAWLEAGPVAGVGTWRQ